jgi:lipopolysaccharide/colanic/teichoic acid biosynthesis glycosyltransferase
MTRHSEHGIPSWKRVLDCTLILLASPLLVPLMAVIALIIRRNSPGPVLFQQQRVGYRGRLFMCLKFRTMHCSAETNSHQSHLQVLINSNAPMTKLDAASEKPKIYPYWHQAGFDERNPFPTK